jgi:glutaminyl-peptide cyclotransferase
MKFNSLGFIGWAMVGNLILMSNQSLAAQTPQTPALLKWTKIHEFPHDTTAFTQGLEVWDDRYFLESTGQYGKSDIRKVEISTGHVVSKASLDSSYFGEGVTQFKKQFFQLTWQEGVLLKWTFDAKSGFKQIEKQPWIGEGWGLTHSKDQLWVSNGSSDLQKIDPKTLKSLDVVHVTLSGKSVDRLNELEFINGKIFANIWMTPTILRIDPHSGIVDGIMDISELVPPQLTQDAVPNGLAWDRKKKHLYVTGKLWPKVFELKFQ